MNKLVEPKPSNPPFEPTKLDRFKRTTKDDLLKASPGDVKIKPLDIIKALFKGNDLICIEGEKNNAKSVQVGSLKSIPAKTIFLNPSVFKNTEPTPGHKIPRSNDNVKERRYMVLENDTNPTSKNGLSEDEALAIRERFNSFCFDLSAYIPLVIAVDTGGKSVHFWFHCGRWSDDVDKVFSLACGHGADPRMAIKSQKARMPNVSGEKDRRNQKLLYFDPSKVGQEWNASHLAKLKGIFANTETCSTPPPSEAKDFSPDGIFYSAETGGYLVDMGAFYRSYSRKSPIKAGIARHLKKKGLTSDDLKEEIPAHFDCIEIDRAVDWAGALAGCKRGPITYGGRSFLITSGPIIPKEEDGKHPLLDSIITQAFPKPDSLAVFLGWLSTGFKAIKAQRHQPSPMMVLAGPPNAGKSLLAWITKLIFGGRSANPMTAWSGQLPWNDDLLGSELLLIDDSVGSTDPRTRKEFGARFKEAIYAGDVTINTRRKSSISLRPVWRVMVCCNETAENLSVIPPLEDGIEDKISLLKVQPIKTPMPASSVEEQEAFANSIRAEIPSFLKTLGQFVIPSHLEDSRTGVTAWKDDELLSALTAISPEKNFEGLIVMALENGSLLTGLSEQWLSAVQVEKVLKMRHSPTNGQAHSLLKYHTNCGSYLSALAKKRSLFVTDSKKVKGITHYLLKCPNEIKRPEANTAFD
ncbi:hypothetical protein OAF62_01970 [Akkermansiaceae bacterium]|nr:hypothetical protein [Akkermansiaceae bacterium]